MFTKNAKVELLKRVPLFSECSKRELGEVASIADELHMPAGRVLIEEGAAGREFILVADGSVEVRRGGRRLRTEAGPSFFGEIALLTGRPRSATVTTTTPVRAFVVTDRAFNRLLERSPTIQRKILAAVAARITDGD